MKPYILKLDDPQANLETVGGKGMSLARMSTGGLPVPNGFHVTTEAYRNFVATNGIQTHITGAINGLAAEDLEKMETASRLIRSYFAEGKIPVEISKAISRAYGGMNDIPVAVRSSATAEDLEDASFAGQQDTYLNIRGIEAVLDAVKRCWASLWTARAIGYRVKNKINQETVRLAVVVQELVFADAAGIMFTANPVNGYRDELVINAVWGLGEAVVSGAVTPDSITVKKDSGRILEQVTAEKKIETVRTETGTREDPVPASKIKKAVLNRAQVRELAALGIKIEQFYGRAMDVEWAMAKGKFAIVQARPITALPLAWRAPDSRFLYTRSSLGEHIPGPATPFFATFGLEIANQATTEMWNRWLGKDARFMFSKEGFYLPINGYVYGGMRMTGEDYITALRVTVLNIGTVIKGSVVRWQAARQKLAEEVDNWQEKPAAELSQTQLLEGVRTIFDAACHYFTSIQTSSLPGASLSEMIFTGIYNNLIRRKQDPEASVFLIGSETTSLRGEKSLYHISQWVKENPSLAEYVMAASASDLAADLCEKSGSKSVAEDDWESWRTKFKNHLQLFGRTAYDFDFANPTPRETPGPMLDTIKGFLSGKIQDPSERQRETVEKRDQARLAVLKRVGWPRTGWFMKLLDWAQKNGPMREDSIFDMGMGHYLIRSYLGELGRRFVEEGAIKKADDIYWLEKTEVEELVNRVPDAEVLPKLDGRIAERKKQWQSYLKESAPVMLPEKSGWGKLIQGGNAERKNGKMVLKGIGTSSGRVTAPACVLLGPEDFGKINPGDILVAVTTTPAWTPLFGTASAVVTDIGGPLSHSSIVAREYGIPAVMATRTATRIIQTGQMVSVDGASGTVILE